MMNMLPLCLVFLLSLLPGAAGANPAVFASTGAAVNPGSVLSLTEGSSSVPIHLFVEFGTTKSTGTPCVEGAGANGHEVCGFDVEVEITGDLAIVSFAPESGVVFEPDPLTTGTTVFRVVGVMAVNPADPSIEAQKLGLLIVDTTGPNGGTVDVSSGAAVRADLAMMSLSSDIVATTNVPEPGELLLFGSGLVALLGLHRHRSRANA